MGDYDLGQLRRQSNKIANVLFLVGALAATIIVAIVILQQDWLWWQIGFALCGIVFAWGAMFAWASKAEFDLTN
jgi:hypothetical protein